MKSRQRKKILKIVARQINSGDFTKLKPVYFRCVDKTISDYIEKKYITEFRPWWYDQIDNWSNMNLGEEHRKHYDKTLAELQNWTGIDIDKYHQYFELNHKEEPKKQRNNRKPRKEKEQPIRKLKNPKEYKIRVIRDGKPEWENIIAEQAFQYRGYEFFIAHYHGWWVVSDVTAGIQIACHDRYKRSVQIAKERIERNFEKYVSQVTQLRKEYAE
ncbi:hypothetical protein [Brevibacillus laterosporus]|uniref:Uncharacterized protein n=1 Tax=Brevibacillus laterosporus TaxID=1465 RepID=A0AAP3DKK6_BRELA|nr:hypothetical protein [Brevibacillus laterosporus]MCR8982647.1 hypothetical protein [Brevibacillus laterosporus]MCZ0809803.1 hypothetical protein [Brevibacillus laterosporus]MCZ0828363.1 hypothetical protein [Brevibacillus laterosporus]MCZ0852373.1 hypothetical protein [Brevibacillus laterosporus]